MRASVVAPCAPSLKRLSRRTARRLAQWTLVSLLSACRQSNQASCGSQLDLVQQRTYALPAGAQPAGLRTSDTDSLVFWSGDQLTWVSTDRESSANAAMGGSVLGATISP